MKKISVCILLSFMAMLLQAGLIEQKVELLLGCSEQTKKARKACHLLRCLKDTRLVGILPLEERAEKEWPLIMHPCLAQFILPESDQGIPQKGNKQYFVEITADVLDILLGEQNVLMSLISQRNKVYAFIERLISEPGSEGQALFQKYGSESIRQLIEMSGNEKYLDAFPVSNDVDLLCKENSFQAFWARCQQLGSQMEVKCTCEIIPFICFTFPVLCRHHDERHQVPFMGYRIILSVPDEAECPMPLLEVSLVSDTDRCGNFSFLFVKDVVEESVRRSFSPECSFMSKSKDRLFLLQKVLPREKRWRSIKAHHEHKGFYYVVGDENSGSYESLQRFFNVRESEFVEKVGLAENKIKKMTAKLSIARESLRTKARRIEELEAELKDMLGHYEQKKTKLEQELSTLKLECETHKDTEASLISKSDQLEKQLDRKNKNLQSKNTELENSKKELSKLKRDYSSLEASISTLKVGKKDTQRKQSVAESELVGLDGICLELQTRLSQYAADNRRLFADNKSMRKELDRVFKDTDEYYKRDRCRSEVVRNLVVTVRQECEQEIMKIKQESEQKIMKIKQEASGNIERLSVFKKQAEEKCNQLSSDYAEMQEYVIKFNDEKKLYNKLIAVVLPCVTVLIAVFFGLIYQYLHVDIRYL